MSEMHHALPISSATPSIDIAHTDAPISVDVPVSSAIEPRRIIGFNRAAPPLARSIGIRGRTNLRVVAQDGLSVASCRAVELSSTGIVVDRGRELAADERARPVRLDIYLPSRQSVSAVGRTVRTIGTRQVLKFVIIRDVDRLTLMEHLDWLTASGSELASDASALP